ncbi:hypothetical protein F6S87_00585 [Bifidobacterium sp. BRDM6]|uniref:Uncharacterized protein n=2 Tax=Bifidobacterium choloepi TaxID=2614131 RepID=A0A6I5MZ94_9BIFI|nr:ATP-binding protein [Bifidobacterium choloepi]NEG69145.1 hypothetical protein [Bifidobacterium choloepi]
MARNAMQMVADRWMMESRQLVNWGTYGGWHEFKPSTDPTLPVTLLAGASESGKSTLVDAQISLLYPKGTPFNKASNTGKSERNDYTYLRGMVGMSDSTLGEKPVYLRGTTDDGRPTAVWGAIVDTYVNEASHDVLSCAKFLYLQAGDGHTAVRRLFATWEKKIDPRVMKRFRNTPFTATQIKQAYDGAVVYQSAESFHSYIWEEMGLSAESCRLLHKIQSADTPSRLDDIFKQGVLGVPEALSYAREAVHQYGEYDENFRSMADKQARMTLLADVRRRHARYEDARNQTTAFDVVDPSTDTGAAILHSWTTANLVAEVERQLPLDQAEHERRLREGKDAAQLSRELGVHIADVDAKMRGIDGGSLERLEGERKQAGELVTETRANSARIGTMFDKVGEEMPADEDAWETRRAAAAEFEATYRQRMDELEEASGQATLALNQARETRAQRQADYDRAEKMRTRISQRMNGARALLCQATGLAEEQMPYIAELMDVREDAEDWRHAMNAVYGSLAQTILVDRRHEDGFAAKVSTIDPKVLPSRTWRFIDVEAGDADPDNAFADSASASGALGADGRHGEGMLSGKLRFRDESPFAGWLHARVEDDAIDAWCVDAIDDLDETRRQVQRDGQVKSGRQGRYGMKDRDEVIGFVTQSYLDMLKTAVDGAQAALDEARATFNAIRSQREGLSDQRTLASLLATLDWKHVDVHGAVTWLANVEQQIEAIRTNPELEALQKRRDSLERDRADAEKKRVLAEQDAENAEKAVTAARAWLEAVRGNAGDDGAMVTGAPELDAEAEELLNTTYIERMTSIGNSAARAHRIVGNGSAGYLERMVAIIRNAVANRLDALGAVTTSAEHDVVTAMETYRTRFEPDNDSVGIDIADYPFYRDELVALEKLSAAAATADEYRRTLNQMLMYLLTLNRAIGTDRGDIYEQLDRINQMLRGQEFGPRHGELSLEVDVRDPDRAFVQQLRGAISALNEWKKGGGTEGAPVPNGQPDPELPELKQLFDGLRPLIGMLQAELDAVHDVNGIKSYGALNLDPRCRSSFYAIVHHDDIGEPDERITSTGGRSGGALQELTSFVYGAALIYLLGNGLTTEPSYTTLFLDEALIKADGRYTQRALKVLPKLGFQVIVSAPESKTGEILGVSTKAYVTYKDDSGHTSLRVAELDPVGNVSAKDELTDVDGQ